MPSKAAAKKEQSMPELQVPCLVNATRAMVVVPYGSTPATGGASRPDKAHRIHPGFNKPTDADTWAQVQEYPLLDRVLGEGSDVTQIASPSDMVDMGGLIDEVIKRSSDLASIEWWAQRETRGRVLTELRRKIAEMKAAKRRKEG